MERQDTIRGTVSLLEEGRHMMRSDYEELLGPTGVW
jgi:hypothetical protein